MATRYSTQMQKQVNPGNELINALTERNSYKRSDAFTRNTTDAVNGNVGNGDVIVLARLPKGAVIQGGSLQFGALGAGVTGTLAISGQNLITAATSLAAAGAAALAPTIALGYGFVVPADADLTLTIGGAAPAGGIAIAGHVDYVQN